MRRCVPLLLVLLAAVTACRRAPASPPLPQVDDEARAYVRLLVALGERDVDSIDYYAGPPEWVAATRQAFPTLAQIRSDAAALLDTLTREAAAGGADAARRTHLVRELRALVARVDLLRGWRPSFNEEGEAFFGVRLPAMDEAQRTRTREEVARLLPGRGGLADRYAALEQRFIIPPSRLPAVFDRALAACREQTRAHLPLPAGERVTVRYVGNKPWSAFSRYQGHALSTIDVNTDFPLTIDRALQLACHEGYPGHHARNTLLDVRLVQDERRPEFTAQAQFSPDALISEGSASMATDLAFPADVRARLEREVLLPLAGIPGVAGDVDRYVRVQQLVDGLALAEAAVAREYLDGRLEFVRAGTALEARALMAHPEATLKYINEYRSYVLTYTLGRELARAFVDAAGAGSARAGDRWAAYEQLIATDPDAVMQSLARLRVR